MGEVGKKKVNKLLLDVRNIVVGPYSQHGWSGSILPLIK
jgi:hypothetical protein